MRFMKTFMIKNMESFVCVISGGTLGVLCHHSEESVWIAATHHEIIATTLLVVMAT